MIHDVLKHYLFDEPELELIRHNENITYKVTDRSGAYVLRIHKPVEGFNLDLLQTGMEKTGLITGEADLLLDLAKQGGMQTQRVKPNACGNAVTILDDGTPVTVLWWIEGQTLDAIDITVEIAYQLGVTIGALHNAFTGCSRKTRYRYDDALLSRMIAEAEKGGKLGHFSDDQTRAIIEALSGIRQHLSDAGDRFMLVHADLGKSNLIYHNGAIIPIDFSLSGYCVPEMDLASVFSHINDDNLNLEVLRGYQSVCSLKARSLQPWGMLLLANIIVRHIAA